MGFELLNCPCSVPQPLPALNISEPLPTLSRTGDVVRQNLTPPFSPQDSNLRVRRGSILTLDVFVQDLTPQVPGEGP